VTRHDLPALTPRDAQLRAVRSVALAMFPPAAVVFLLELPARPATYAAIGAIAFICLQGAAYWGLKYRQVTSRAPRPVGLAMFRWLRLIDVAVLVGALAVIVTDPEVGTVLLWVLALGEYVSLYVVHLYYVTPPPSKRAAEPEWLHAPRLARDLRAGPVQAHAPGRGKPARRRR